jgi:hypothetical protein
MESDNQEIEIRNRKPENGRMKRKREKTEYFVINGDSRYMKWAIAATAKVMVYAVKGLLAKVY